MNEGDGFSESRHINLFGFDDLLYCTTCKTDRTAEICCHFFGDPGEVGNGLLGGNKQIAGNRTFCALFGQEVFRLENHKIGHLNRATVRSRQGLPDPVRVRLVGLFVDSLFKLDFVPDRDSIYSFLWNLGLQSAGVADGIPMDSDEFESTLLKETDGGRVIVGCDQPDATTSPRAGKRPHGLQKGGADSLPFNKGIKADHLAVSM